MSEQFERLSLADFVASRTDKPDASKDGTTSFQAHRPLAEMMKAQPSDAKASAPPPPRQSFWDTYETGYTIGKGNFSKVIAVKPKQNSASTNPSLNARLALVKRRDTLACKVLDLPPEGIKPAPGQTSRDDALRELDQLLELPPHDNIISLVDFYIDGNTCHLITELSRGGDLKKALEIRGSFCEEDAQLIMKCVLRGLSHMHAHGVAHRDLKLENVLIANESGITDVQIADLGMSKRLSTDTKHTVCGTPMFMAPEVLIPAQTEDAARYGKVSKYSVKADVWSAGIISFMMLAGHPPFAGNGVSDLFRAIRARQIDFSDPTWELVSDEAKHFVNWILEVDPALRPSADEALQHPWLNMD